MLNVEISLQIGKYDLEVPHIFKGGAVPRLCGFPAEPQPYALDAGEMRQAR